MGAGLIQAGQRITAVLLNSIGPLGVIKGADQSVTSSTALVNDNALTVPLVAGATYLFDCYLDYEGGTTGASDLKWQWSIPAGATMRYGADYPSTSGLAVTIGTNTAATVPHAGTNGAGTLMSARMKGSVTMSSTAGPLQLQWAQVTSSGTATIIHSQSYLALWRMS